MFVVKNKTTNQYLGNWGATDKANCRYFPTWEEAEVARVQMSNWEEWEVVSA